MQCYRIKNWNEIYEINRTREIKKMSWLPVPIKLDGDGYTLIMSDPDGANIFGAWIAMLEVAAHCEPRGTLIRGAGIPHDAAGISRVTRIPEKIVKKMLEFCYKKCNWLEIIEIETACDNPAGTCDNPAEGCAVQDIDNIDNITGHNITDSSDPMYKIEKRSSRFLEEINVFKEYEISLLNEFYLYWSEPNKSKTKMRYELQPTWDLKRRLKTWADRQKMKPQQRYGRQEVSRNELKEQFDRIKLS